MGIKSLLVMFISASAFASNLPVDDADFACIPAAQANRYVQEFRINVQSFGGMELCNSAVDTKKLFNDLQLVEEGRFSGDKRNLFIRDVIPTSQYFSWLKEMTAGIRRGHDMPTATAYNSFGYFTMQDGWAHLSTLGRVGTLIHEARHTDGYGHTQCTHGPYKDASLSGCDSSLNQEGAHGIEMEYYSRVVLQGENFHPVYQQMARLMNLGRSNFVFNQDPMRQSDGLVAASDEDLILLEQDGTMTAQPVAGLAEYRLHRASHGVTLHAPGKALALDLYDPAGVPVEDEYSYFKLLLDGRIQNVIDLQEVDLANRRYLVVLTSQGQLRTYQFASGRWSEPASAADVATLITTAPNGAEGLFVLTKAGQVQGLNPATLRRGDTIPGTWPEDAEEYVKWGTQILEVTSQGAVRETGSGKAFAPLSNRTVHQLVKAPLYNAFERAEGK